LLILLNFRKIKRALSFIRLKEYKLAIAGFEFAGTLEYNAAAQDAAWKIYVELVSRVAVNKLAPRAGLLRESLDSLYMAFTNIRAILSAAGSELAKPPSSMEKWTVATLTFRIMNDVLRPFLSKWHPLLGEYENTKPSNMARYTHEQHWSEQEKFRTELDKLNEDLKNYVTALKDIAEGRTTTSSAT
jgi:hypothetical protein